MAIFVGIFLILPGLTGIHSISTVSKVMVEKGGSISIPCFYESKYTDNVKYLCKGCKWRICSYEVKTNQYNSTKYLISDDQNQGVVTWTINDLTEEDTDCYWCVMEINQGRDDGNCFIVFVTGKGDATLYVDSQEVTGFIGDQITIDCHYRGSKQIKWCRTGGEGPTSCIKDSGKKDDTKVTINRNTPGVITVTMSELRERSSGWYWCTDEDLQMPVHVTIKERPTTTTIATTTTTTTTTTTRQSTTISSTSKPVNHTYVSQEPTTEQTGTHSSSNHLLSFIIPLCLLLLIVTVAVLTWFMLKRRKSPATAEDEQTVTYSTVSHVRKTTAQCEEDVTYCNVTNRKSTSGQVEAIDVRVTYSTLALQR
ncbi:polymeric immunoglobulin receptor-like isoform X2 [Sphaeramia orbicularis]|uniref:polymeric immunoglobulin receptor-like isoform X2 n=1 Tax=Sphaeramia orbicularis TaxID=375764 RepID=UPI00117CBA23|nr:polymeric immunoglobulin receptor-like isoform X2 [Sphaeramia orbicularis]